MRAQLRRLRAFLTGYFWVPCPWCGTHFAGYEVSDDSKHFNSIPAMDGHGSRLICPSCTVAGVGDNLWFKEHGLIHLRDGIVGETGPELIHLIRGTKIVKLW